MELKYSEFEIPPQDPYKNDLLNRREFGENLTKIISQITSPLTISVNGSWGTGKTIFLKMWNQSLKDAEFSTIYFSAWEDDYCDDALLALMGQIWGSINEGSWKEMGNTFKEIAMPLLKSIGSQILTNATGVDVEDLKSNPEKMLEKYVVATSDLKSVKERLATFSEKCRQETEKPLVIIIDELDRCRPLFAIELLEKIKHLFELPGVIFVLGIDREQLGHSIQSVYGNIDVAGYLRRFIDLEFLLKMNDTVSFFKSIFEKYELTNALVTPAANPTWATQVSKCFGLSLREREYLARTVVVGTTIIPAAVARLLLPLLIALKLRDDDFYKKIIGGECNATEIIEQLVSKHNAWELFGINPETKEYAGGFAPALCSELYAIAPRRWRDDVVMALREGKDNPSKLSEHLFHHVVQKVYYMKQSSTKHFDSEFKEALHLGIPINYLSKCIELVEFKDETQKY